MSTITLRATKGSPLTNTEVDNNFSNLNTDKLESSYAGALNSLTGGSSIVTLSSSTGVTTGVWKATAIGSAYGGTGIANNAASTLTISGNYGSTFSVSGAYTYTFPGANSTLVSLTGSETLTNKTLTFPTIDNIKLGYSTTTNAAGTTTLSSTSNSQQFFTGSGAQQVNLPDTSTLATGVSYTIVNQSSGTVTVKTTAGTNLVFAVPANTQATFYCISTASNAAASWYYNAGATAGSTSIITLGTVTTGTWNGTAIGVGYGGTGASSFTAYAVLCGGTTSTGAVQAVASVGTAGYVLTSNGAGALPTFQSAAGGVTVTDDTSTNSNARYPLFTSATSGSVSGTNVSTTKLYFNPSTGTLNATNFNSLSDETLKTNITPIVNATDIVRALNGVEFDWTDTGDKSSGVIAQQLEPILPHLVNTNEEGIKSVNYQGITAYLIEAFKEIDQRLQNLEAK